MKTDGWRTRYIVVSSLLGLAGLVFAITSASRTGAAPRVREVDPRVLSASVPILDATQRQRAIDLVEQNRPVDALLAQRSSTVLGVVPWLDTSGRVLGASITLGLGSPLTVHGIWRGLVSCSPDGSRFGSFNYEATQRNVRFLTVLVDLSRYVVMSIAPDGGAQAQGKSMDRTSRALGACR